MLRVRCEGFEDCRLDVELADDSVVLEQIVLRPAGGP
jgi:hypothetical protein